MGTQDFTRHFSTFKHKGTGWKRSYSFLPFSPEVAQYYISRITACTEMEVVQKLFKLIVHSISYTKVFIPQFWNAGGSKRADSICVTGTYQSPAFEMSSINAHLSHSKSSKQVRSVPQDTALNPSLASAGWHSRARSADDFGTEKTPFEKTAHIRKMVQQTAVPQSPMENTLPESLLGFGRSFFWKKG